MFLLKLVLDLYLVILETQLVSLKNEIAIVLSSKRYKQFQIIPSNFRGDGCLVVSKHSNCKIFDKAMGNDNIAFFYKKSSTKLFKGNEYMFKNYYYFLISPEIEPNPDFTCYHIEYRFKDQLTKSIMDELYRFRNIAESYLRITDGIMLKADDQFPCDQNFIIRFISYATKKIGIMLRADDQFPCKQNFFSYITKKILPWLPKKSFLGSQNSFRAEELFYKREDHSTHSLIEFGSDEIFNIKKTIHKEKPEILIKIEDAMNKLVSMRKATVSKSEWSTMAVELLLDILMQENVMKEKINLKLYPDVVPILFPFRFLSSLSRDWGFLDIVTIGVDLRNIETSELAFLFNLDIVRSLINNGGIYVVSREY